MRRCWRAVAAAVLAALAAAGPAAAAPCRPAPRAPLPDTDGARDAQAGTPLFERVAVPGFTDVRRDTASLAVEDFDGDRRADLFAVYNDGTMRMLLGRGCLRFRRHAIEIVDSPYTAADPPGGAGIVNWADLNGDGHLDALLTRNADGANTTQLGARPADGNSLLLSRGRFDRFTDAARRLGVRNAGAYNRGSAIADVDGDGWLDLAVGADQIGTPEFGGAPVQRLYVWRPGRGRFADVGGGERVPGFGGPLACDPARDKASPGILLRDLDGDLRPELVLGYHNDMLGARQLTSRCPTGERRFGLFAWRNASRPGDPRFARVPRARAPLGGVGQLRYDAARGDYDVVARGLGLPYVTAADAFNSGRLDLLAVGPTDPEWHVNSDMVAGALFRNRGGLRLVDETARRGLAPLSWTAARWARFYDTPIHPTSPLMDLACRVSNRRPTCERLAAGDHQLYASSVAWGDFDNDGCLDF
ncbi:MAG TPA: VCBS repeat-containing protein, partial [Capillimicrobium sp.]